MGDMHEENNISNLSNASVSLIDNEQASQVLTIIRLYSCAT